MAGEDYRINGVNISKIIKQDKINYGEIKWNKLIDRFDINVISRKNNIIEFSIKDKIYFYGIPSQKIRRKGSNDWTGRIITELKKDFKEIPLKDKIVCFYMNDSSFGEMEGFKLRYNIKINDVIKVDDYYLYLSEIWEKGKFEDYDFISYIFEKVNEDILKINEEVKINYERKTKPIKIYSPNDNAFGKHKDKTWIEVKQQYPGYIDWLLKETKSKSLLKMLKQL